MKRLAMSLACVLVVGGVVQVARAAPVEEVSEFSSAEASFELERSLPRGGTRFSFISIYAEQGTFEEGFADLTVEAVRCTRGVARHDFANAAEARRRPDCVELRPRFAFVDLEPNQLTIDEDGLTTASLNVVFDDLEFLGGTKRRPVDVAVDIDWTGVGDIGTEDVTRHFRQGTCIFDQEAQSRFRDASASASIGQLDLLTDFGFLRTQTSTTTEEGCDTPSPSPSSSQSATPTTAEARAQRDPRP